LKAIGSFDEEFSSKCPPKNSPNFHIEIPGNIFEKQSYPPFQSISNMSSIEK